MAKTVVGLFDNRADAEEAVQELLDDGFIQDEISVASKHSEDRKANVEYVEEDGHEQIEDMAKGAGTGAAIGGAAGLLLSLTALAIPGIGPVLAAGPLAAIIAGAGVGAATGGAVSGLTRLGLGDEDANAYAEGLRRGGALVTVNAPDEMAERAVAIFKQRGAVEIDKRTAQWREEGWTGFEDMEQSAAERPSARGLAGGSSEVAAEHERIPAASQGANMSGTEPRARDEFTVPSPQEFAIPVVEERLQVDKREVESGGVRVNRRVTETPVEEQVDLREERVHVERRPADYTFHGSEMEAFKESQLEIREAYEELVLNKKARVVEEIVVSKDVEQHTETVRDTLRRTDVEIESIEPDRARGAAAGPRAGERERTEDA